MKIITVRLNLSTFHCKLLTDGIPQAGPLSFEITQIDQGNAPDANGMVLVEPGPRRVTVWLDGQVVFTTLDAPTTVERKGKELIFTWQVEG